MEDMFNFILKNIIIIIINLLFFHETVNSHNLDKASQNHSYHFPAS